MKPVDIIKRAERRSDLPKLSASQTRILRKLIRREIAAVLFDLYRKRQTWQ